MNEFERNTQHELRAEESRLDANIEECLAQARLNAVAHSHRHHAPRFLWPTLSSVALASVLAIVFVWPNGQGENTDEMADIHQNLDFYSWMAENQNGSDT
jgi:hypothetical protein